MKINQFFLFIICSLLTCASLSAQKFGFVNTSELIESHPQVAVSNAQLEAFSDSLLNPFEAKAKAFEAKYQFFVEEVNAGTLSKVSIDKRTQELQKEQQDLQAEDKRIQFAIVQKREQLLTPILQAIDALLQAIGKEGGYTMIFDASVTGALLYAADADDLTKALKEKIVGKS